MPDGQNDDASSAPRPAENSTVQAPAPARILVVDDDFLISLATVDMLEDLGYETIEANSGEQALEIVRGEGVIDAMLTDFSMPSMNGVELAEAALALRPGLPILVATGYAELPSGDRLELPCLSKPFRLSQLSDAIGALLGR